MKKMKDCMRALKNNRGDIAVYTCFFLVAMVMLVSFLLLYASVQITCINIRNGVKMELNNLSGSIYADTYRSQREVNFSEYLNTLYSSNEDVLREAVTEGLASKVPLTTEDYQVKNIDLEFQLLDDRVEYRFRCEVTFYFKMFGRSYPSIVRQIELTGYHNTKF